MKMARSIYALCVCAVSVYCAQGCGKGGSDSRPSGIQHAYTQTGKTTTIRTCDFRKYGPVILSDFVRCCLRKRVFPEFPAEIRKNGTSLQVEIAFVVDKKGKVVDTCANSGPMHCVGEDEKTQRRWMKSVVNSTATAVRKWLFAPNSGFHETGIQYVKARVVFRYTVVDGRRIIAYIST